MEEAYVLIKHLNFTYSDIYRLPVWKKRWFLQKFADELEQQQNRSTESPAQNIPSRNSSKRIFN